jgi:L-threonylcarbamoyladenylate synthase
MLRTRTIAIDPDRIDLAAIGQAARMLRQGALVVFPTETVYGLGAHALDADAVAAVFAAKGRPADNPLIVHVATIGQARALAADWPDAAEALADAFWPGPLTLVVARGEGIPDVVTARLDTVAIRVPAHPVAMALLRATGVPVAAPSANLSGSVSPTTAAHALEQLDGRVDELIDGGPSDVGLQSTVVSVAGAPRVLRRGMIGLDRLRAVIPDIEDAGAADGPARSPGLAARHYAPRARVILDGSPATGKVAQLVRGDGVGLAEDGDRVVLTLPRDPDGYAAALYAALHQADSLGCDAILVDPIPGDAAWDAIRDRLTRAAATA